MYLETLLPTQDRQDRAGNSQVSFARDQRRSAKVCTGPNAFEDERQGEKALDIGVRKVVGTRLRWCDACSLESADEKSDVCMFIGGNVFRIVVLQRGVSCTY